MIEKAIIDTVLKATKHGGVSVTYWDGDTRTYGPDKPYLSIHFKDPSVAKRLAVSTSLGFGESYSEGLIDVKEPLTGVVRFASQNPMSFGSKFAKLRAPKLHRNIKDKQKNYIAHHYDIGNNFYSLWLDKSMLYTCAYFRKPSDTLEKAQEQKITHVLNKLRLEKGMTLADLGCGWGDLLITAAKKHKIKGIGVTLSEEQVAFANKRAKKEGVDKLVKFELLNYQDLAKRGAHYDRVVSVGMIEHVGKGNHHTYFETVDKLLKPGGISVAHFISQQQAVEQDNDAWIDKYIFPGGYLPSVARITALLPKYGFYLTDYEDLRMHYAMTLHEWRRRYNQHKPEVIAMFDEKFYRMWDFWLACSEASFEYGVIGLSHFVFTKGLNNDLPLTREDWYR